MKKVRRAEGGRPMETTGKPRKPSWDDLSTGSESHLEDGASVPSVRQKGKAARKRHTRRMETQNLETEKWKTEILEYNMTGMLTNETRYGSSETKERNNKNFKKKNKEIGKMKIENLTVGVHNTNEISKKVAPNLENKTHVSEEIGIGKKVSEKQSWEYWNLKLKDWKETGTITVIVESGAYWKIMPVQDNKPRRKLNFNLENVTGLVIALEIAKGELMYERDICKHLKGYTIYI